MADENGAPGTERGNVGRQTYQRVRELLDAGGVTTRGAFEQVAQETGRSVGTVQTAYYRVARSIPGGGGVRQRPRSGGRRAVADGQPRGRTRRQTGSDIEQLVRDAQRALDALAARARELEAGQRDLRDQARRYDEIRRILGRS